jgi:hypothetical protein
MKCANDDSPGETCGVPHFPVRSERAGRPAGFPIRLIPADCPAQHFGESAENRDSDCAGPVAGGGGEVQYQEQRAMQHVLFVSYCHTYNIIYIITYHICPTDPTDQMEFYVLTATPTATTLVL